MCLFLLPSLIFCSESHFCSRMSFSAPHHVIFCSYVIFCSRVSFFAPRCVIFCSWHVPFFAPCVIFCSQVSFFAPWWVLRNARNKNSTWVDDNSSKGNFAFAKVGHSREACPQRYIFHRHFGQTTRVTPTASRLRTSKKVRSVSFARTQKRTRRRDVTPPANCIQQ